MAGTARFPELPLAGRDAELATLRAAVEDVRRGRGRSLLLMGEPGVGKSRLTDEVAELARAAGMHVVRGRCHPDEQDIPLAPMRRRLPGIPDTVQGARELRALVAGNLGVLNAASDLRFRMVTAAIEMIVALIDRVGRPSAFLLEDLHWADAESLQVLRTAVRRTADRQVLVLGNARPQVGRDLAALLQGSIGSLETLTLASLPSEAVHRAVRQVVGGRLGPRLRREVERAGGNPFYLTHLLADLHVREAISISDGVAELAPGVAAGVGSLADHVAARMAELDELQQQVVQLAALAELTVPLIAGVLDISLAHATRLVEAALRSGLVIGDREHKVRMRHELLRGAVLERMPDVVRGGLHAALARQLQAQGADVTRVAPHLVRADDGVGPPAAMAAAGRALLPTAPSVAMPLLRRAYDSGMEEVGADLITSLILLGDVSQAETLLSSVGEGPPSQPSERMQGRLRARLALAQLAFMRGDLLAAAEEFLAVARALPATAGPEDEVASNGLDPCLVLADAAVALVLAGRPGQARQIALEASARGSITSRAITLLVRGWVAGMRGDPKRCMALVLHGNALGRTAQTADVDAVQPAFFLGQALLWDERPQEAVETVAAGLRQIEASGMGWHAAALHATAATALLRLARWEEAEVEAEAGLSHAEDVGVEHGVPTCLAILALISIGRGEDADPLLEAAESASRRLSGQGGDVVLWYRGVQAMAKGDHERSLRVLGLLWARLERAGIPQRLMAMGPDLARAAAAAGDRGRLVQLQAWAAGPISRTAPQRSSSLQGFAAGLVDGDVEAVVAAGHQLLALDDPLGGARMLADAARLDPAHPAGAEAGTRARVVLEQAGGLVWLRGLPSASGRAATPSRARFGWDSLTPRQERIVRMVGRGLSNSEIAAALSVSRRTVESHLHHTYTKLDVRSRVELAVLAAGMPPAPGQH